MQTDAAKGISAFNSGVGSRGKCEIQRGWNRTQERQCFAKLNGIRYARERLRRGAAHNN
jgi:hypothetical protein